MTSIIRPTMTKAPAARGVAALLLLLWLAVVLSAVVVVYVSHDARLKLGELEKLRREQSQLQVVWGQYLLEESAWSAYGRIEKLAAEELSMAVPQSADIIMVTPDEG